MQAESRIHINDEVLDAFGHGCHLLGGYGREFRSQQEEPQLRRGVRREQFPYDNSSRFSMR